MATIGRNVMMCAMLRFVVGKVAVVRGRRRRRWRGKKKKKKREVFAKEKEK